jgi:hypothetical protein
MDDIGPALAALVASPAPHGPAVRGGPEGG